MISLLKGEVFDLQDQSAIILCAGVGYEVNLAPQSVASLEKGQEITVYVTESLSPYDGTSLYGFLSKEEKQLFLLFKENIPGTGPKKAMEFLSKALRSLPDFHKAISTKDPKILTAIFGFTAKTAQKLIDSLSGKIDGVVVQGEAKIKMAEVPFMTEVLSALTALGFSATESRKALERLNSEQKISPNLEENIKAALRILRK